MSLIERECDESKEHMFSLIENTQLVALTPRNVALAEAMIKNDSAYIKSSDVNAVPKDKYAGSTAYWMTQLKLFLLGEKRSVKGDEYKKVLSGAITAIDRENSTHLSSDGVGPKEMLARLLDLNKEELLDFLRNPKDTNYELIVKLSELTKPIGEKYKPRKNLSFATKFCHYACFYLFDGEDAQDNYSIYDSVVKKALPKYCKYYGIAAPKFNKKDWRDYLEYQGAIDAIIEKLEDKISRNGFDHLVWYYFKGRN